LTATGIERVTAILVLVGFISATTATEPSVEGLQVQVAGDVTLARTSPQPGITFPFCRKFTLPAVPTFKELGLEPVNRPAFYGIYGPKGMPKELVQKLNAAMLKVLQDPAVIKRIEASGSKVMGNTPEQFAQQLKAEFEVYKKVVDAQKLKLD
jgi:tripartite-type tricarboxylate transporter receptor subunit TctC